MLIFRLQPWSKQTIPFVLHNFHKEFGILHFNVKMYQDNQAVAGISIRSVITQREDVTLKAEACCHPQPRPSQIQLSPKAHFCEAELCGLCSTVLEKCHWPVGEYIS